MKKSIQTTHTLNAPIENIWNLIKTGANWENWLPILTGSTVDGNIRYCDMDGGEQLEELFLSNVAEKTFIYSIEKQNVLPAKNLVGLIRLEKVDHETTTLYWSLDLEVESLEIFESLQEQISGIYIASAARLAVLATDTVSA